MIRSTHTFAELEISASAFNEIKQRLEDAGPDYVGRYIDCSGGRETLHWGGDIGLISAGETAGAPLSLVVMPNVEITTVERDTPEGKRIDIFVSNKKPESQAGASSPVDVPLYPPVDPPEDHIKAAFEAEAAEHDMTPPQYLLYDQLRAMGWEWFCKEDEGDVIIKRPDTNETLEWRRVTPCGNYFLKDAKLKKCDKCGAANFDDAAECRVTSCKAFILF